MSISMTMSGSTTGRGRCQQMRLGLKGRCVAPWMKRVSQSMASANSVLWPGFRLLQGRSLGAGV